MQFFTIILSFLILTSSAFAESIILKSGRVIEGEIIEKTDDYVKINFNGVNLTFYSDEIYTDNNATASSMDKLTNTDLVNKSLTDENKNEEVFKELVTKLMNSMDSVKEEDAKLEAWESYRYELTSFSTIYPNSRFADDADYLVLARDSINSVNIKLWEAFINKHENQKLEDFTKEKLQEKGFVPNYDLLLAYYRGQKSFFENKDYAETVKYWIIFSEELESRKLESKDMLMNIYLLLMVSYGNLNKQNECRKIYNKAKLFFPELEEHYKKILKAQCNISIP